MQLMDDGWSRRCYLTSTVVENRSQGTRLLSEVLVQLHSHALLPDEGLCKHTPLREVSRPSPVFSLLQATKAGRGLGNFLTKSAAGLLIYSSYLPILAVHYLAVFYCDRLKDRAVIVPHVLCGLHALVRTHFRVQIPPKTISHSSPPSTPPSFPGLLSAAGGRGCSEYLQNSL